MNIWGPNLIKISSKNLFFVYIYTQNEHLGSKFHQKFHFEYIYTLKMNIWGPNLIKMPPIFQWMQVQMD